MRYVKIAALTALFLLATGLELAFGARGQFDRTLKVTGPVEMEVTTGSGNITVHVGSSSSVQIHGTIRVGENWHLSEADAENKVKALEANPPIEQDGNFVRIGHIEDPELRRNVSISYEIETPAETRLTSKTGSGNQQVSGIGGPVSAGTGSGNVTVSNIGDEVRAESGSGNLELGTIKGEVRASTGSGYIRAQGVAGGFTGRSGSGDITLEQTSPGVVNVESGSGSARLSGVDGSVEVRAGSGNISVQGTPSHDWTLHTGSGAIELHLPAQASFDLDAHTSSGKINTTRPITVQGSLGHGRLQGKVGNGGSRLDLQTGSGDIDIE